MASLQLEPLARKLGSHSDSLDTVPWLWRHGSRLSRSRLLEKRMSTASLQQALSFDRTGAAKERLLSRRGEPLFYANWDNVLFIHYELESDELQRCIPF